MLGHSRALKGAALLTILCLGLLALSGTLVKAKEVTITFATWGSADAEKIWKRDVQTFEKLNPGIRVNLIVVPWEEYWQKVQTMIAGGMAGDIIRLGGQQLPGFAARGVLEDLGPYVAADKEFNLADFLKAPLDGCRYRGTLFGLPDHFSPLILYYNASMFKAAGLDVPVNYYRKQNWTWDVFLDLARKLTKDLDGDGRIDQYGAMVDPTWNALWQSFVVMNGGQVYNDDLTRCKLDDPKSVEAIQFLADLRVKYGVCPPPDVMQAGNAWELGKVGMVFGWPSSQNRWGNMLNFEFDVAPLPKPKDGKYATVQTINVMSILRGSRHKQEAWKFLKFIVGEEVQRLRISDFYIVSARKAVAEEALVRRKLPCSSNAVILEAADFSFPLIAPPKFQEVDAFIKAELEPVAVGKTTAKDAIEKVIVPGVNKILSE